MNLWETLSWAGLASPPQFAPSKEVLWLWAPFEERDEKLGSSIFLPPLFPLSCFYFSISFIKNLPLSIP